MSTQRKFKKNNKIPLKLDDLIYPLFVREGIKLKEEIPLMPNVFRLSIDKIEQEVGLLQKDGIRKILLFGIPQSKDARASHAYKKDNIVSKAVKVIRAKYPDVIIFTDVCLCAYTLDAHCGVINGKSGGIDIDKTLNKLSLMALSHAEAGAHYVAPSAMAAGQVGAIRNSLNIEGHRHVKIMGYSAKFASSLYGPFRAVADSAPRFGDRKGYQLNFTGKGPALRKLEEDINQGADIIMVKPALWYLDVINEAKKRFNRPLAIYSVSGEYAMIKNGIKCGIWDEKEIVFETMAAFKRSGADYIITYHAKEVARWFA
ncbi:MAG: porphobilinogen synthase [Candidatus Omnitrophota bacterium]